MRVRLWGTRGSLASPASLPVSLPHFENEDVDLCGNTLIVVNDREVQDLGSVMYVVSIANPKSRFNVDTS